MPQLNIVPDNIYQHLSYLANELPGHVPPNVPRLPEDKTDGKIKLVSFY
jgi:hypothetical protein